jgi:outer membrane protein assembly factor BamB
MIRSNRSWRFGILAAVAIAVFATLAIFFIWNRRDRPRLSDSTARPERASADGLPSALAPTDWPQFRGPGGGGSIIGADVPFEWSDTQNVRWKTELPGPGSSSPIVVSDRVFVTCYSGYGTNTAGSGNVNDLKRHLLCLNRSDGQIAWTVDVAAAAEDYFRGYLTEHGYASHTPVSDGEAVYAFFGKSGVWAYDLDGNALWHAEVGTRSDSMRWGSAASPIVYHNLVIVNAASECRAIRAFDKKTGEQIWEARAESLDLCFGTPALVDLTDGRKELALCVPGELWGLDPDTGTLNWYARVRMTGNVSPSVTVHDGIVYATGGYQGRGAVAVAAGGHGDVTDTHVRWSVRQSTYVPSPLWHDGHLYWVDDRGIAVCLNAETGQVIYEKRLSLRGRGGRGVYASLVRVGDKLIAVTRTAGTAILAARPEYEPITTNTLSDASQFNATPAVAGNQLFLRSDRAIYCISTEAASR